MPTWDLFMAWVVTRTRLGFLEGGRNNSGQTGSAHLQFLCEIEPTLQRCCGKAGAALATVPQTALCARHEWLRPTEVCVPLANVPLWRIADFEMYF